jgi:hypothetical protein
MKSVAIYIAVILTARSVYAAAPEHTVSPSREFIIYGADPATRGVVSGLAEHTKANLLKLLRQRDNWTTPIVINLQPEQPNLPELRAADLRFSQTGFGLKLQLDLVISQNVDPSLIEHEVLRAILLEMMYRTKPHIAAGTVLVEPPDWLVRGILALAPEQERGPLVEALTTADKPLSLEKFLHQRPELLDSAGRGLYRAYSLALVEMLIEAKKGPAGLAQYIAHLSDAANEQVTDLKAQFPSLSQDLESDWQSKLDRLRNLRQFQVLTFAESERRLDELLRVKITEANKPLKLMTLAELARRKSTPNEKLALNELSRELLPLVSRTNPVLRPIAREYQQIATLLARGKKRGTAKRLSRLEGTRKNLAARMSDIDDYMNWFEATQMTSRSGNFRDYLKAVDQSQATVSRRRDPLSAYVDAVENQFEE